MDALINSYYIESDSWTNYRNDLMDGFRGYKNNGKHQYDFKELRQAIYKNHKEEIVNDLNTDLLKDINYNKTTKSNQDNRKIFNAIISNMIIFKKTGKKLLNREKILYIRNNLKVKN